ncbi:MAG TPA: hypothetical protein VFG49_16565 [Dyella sp.]|uniref:hypothetical protein n=1 Tax=Dyella sp. TaxID=1869338 RepID=UPI002D78534C|nr:hypothetical protein [Dyella sp.]HET6555140.1 hypothetical protein [Dyella sp.]
MRMSNHVARQGHVILRAVLTALSIAVLLVCMLMWWMTMFGTPQPVASSSQVQDASASTSE